MPKCDVTDGLHHRPIGSDLIVVRGCRLQARKNKNLMITKVHDDHYVTGYEEWSGFGLTPDASYLLQ